MAQLSPPAATSSPTIDLPLFSPPKGKLLRKKFSDYRVKKNIFKGEDRETYVYTMRFWASFVQKNVHSLSQAALYPTNPPMQGKRWGGRLCALAWMAFPKKVTLTTTLKGPSFKKSHLFLQTWRGELWAPFIPVITWKCTCLLSQTELTGIHTRRGEAGWIYKANIVFCGERVFTHRNKYVLFPTFQMKKYTLLHCKYFGNVCQKPKTKRETLPLEREKNPHLLQPWLHKVQH